MDCKAEDLVAFLNSRPHLTDEDKRGVLNLLKQALEWEDLLYGVDCEDDYYGSWQHCGDIHHVQISKKRPTSPDRVYKVRGAGDLPANVEVAFELACNIELVPKWDPLFKEAEFLSYEADEVAGVEVGYIHAVYGLPGFSFFISDRDVVMRAVRVYFPNGIRVMYVRSATEPEAPIVENHHAIRAQMGDSGYVFVPKGQDACKMVLMLQLDPKGWVPARLVDFCAEARALCVARIRRMLRKLSDPLGEHLAVLNKQQGGVAVPHDQLAHSKLQVAMVVDACSDLGRDANRRRSDQEDGDFIAVDGHHIALDVN